MTIKFNTKKFLDTKFEPRTEEVKVPDLQDFFEGDPVWLVRGLTAHELAKADERASNVKSIANLAEALVQPGNTDKVKSIQAALGIGDDTPKDLAKRFEHFVLGSLEPKVEMDIAVKIAETFPVEFYQITNTIVRITGKGQLAEVKQQPSGKTKK